MHQILGASAYPLDWRWEILYYCISALVEVERRSEGRERGKDKPPYQSKWTTPSRGMTKIQNDSP